MTPWIERALELGNAAPYSVRIPYGVKLQLPSICAGCGEAAVRTQPMSRGATDETNMLDLPVCDPCYKTSGSDYWKRKMRMGCLVFVALVAGFGGSLAFETSGLKLASWAVAGAVLIAGYAAGSGAGRGERVPMVRRPPYIQFGASSMEVFASSAFVLAAYDALPDLRQVK